MAKTGSDKNADKPVEGQPFDVSVDCNGVYDLIADKGQRSISKECSSDEDGSIESYGEPERIPIDRKMKERD